MIIKQLTYLLLEQVNGGIPTDDSKFNYRVAKAFVLSAVAFLLKKKAFDEANQSEGNYTSESNSVTKTVDVKTDEDTGLKYVELLGESIDLGGMRSYSISSKNPFGRWNIKFVPITRNEVFMQSMLPNVPDVVQFYKEDNRLYLKGDISEVKLQLTQKSLLPSDDDDNIPEDISAPALEYAYKLAYPELTFKSDRANDGVPNDN